MVGGRLEHGAAAGGGQRGGAPHPRRPADIALGNDNKKMWLDGNRNRDVHEQKTVLTGSPFRSENTPMKVNNKRLQQIIDELRELKNLLSGQSTWEASEESLKQYHELLGEFEKIKKEIKSAQGMAIPLPKDVGKKPKLKVSLFK